MFRAGRVALATVVALGTTGVTTAFALDSGSATTAATSWSGSATSPIDPAIRLAPMTETDPAATRTITVEVDARFQTWQGTGAALTDASVALLTDNAEAQALLFDDHRTDGLALDILRLPLTATDFSTDWWTWGWNAKRGIATPPAEAIAAIDLTLQLDQLAGGLDVVATPWTAPASMKTSRRLDGGALHRRFVTDYAGLLAAQTDHLVAAGVPLAALTIVNEPGHSGNYPTMTMTDAQLVDVAGMIDASLEANGVELWAVDHNWSDRDRVDAVLAGAPGAFEAAAFHCYSGSPDQMAGLDVPAIVTECTGTTDTWAGTFGWDARNLVVDAAEAGSTGLMMWNLALDPQHGPKAPGGCTDCRGLLTIDPTTGAIDPTPEYYTLAHVGRAAPAGSVRLGTTSAADLPAVAFERPDGSVGVFGHNDTGAPQIVAVSIGGVTHRFVVPAGALFDVGGAADLPEPLPVSSGDIAIAVDGSRWFVEQAGTGLVRHQITSQQTFVCDLGRGGNAIAVADTVLDRLPMATPRADAECILRAPEGDAHVVNDAGLREWIPDGATWFCEIDRGLEVIQTTRTYVDAVPEGDWRVCN